MSKHNFLAGRDLAVQMMRAGQDADTLECHATIEARYREGHPQDNFALRFLQQLLERPELAEGFAAVLSDYLSCGDCVVDPELYERLTLRQMVGHSTEGCEPTNGNAFACSNRRLHPV